MIRKYTFFMFSLFVSLGYAMDITDDKEDSFPSTSSSLSKSYDDSDELDTLNNGFTKFSLNENVAPLVEEVYVEKRGLVAKNYTKIAKIMHSSNITQITKKIPEIAPLYLCLRLFIPVPGNCSLKAYGKRNRDSVDVLSNQLEHLALKGESEHSSKRMKEDLKEEKLDKKEKGFYENFLTKEQTINLQDLVEKSSGGFGFHLSPEVVQHLGLTKEKIKKLRSLLYSKQVRTALEGISNLFPKELNVRAVMVYKK